MKLRRAPFHSVITKSLWQGLQKSLWRWLHYTPHPSCHYLLSMTTTTTTTFLGRESDLLTQCLPRSMSMGVCGGPALSPSYGHPYEDPVPSWCTSSAAERNWRSMTRLQGRTPHTHTGSYRGIWPLRERGERRGKRVIRGEIKRQKIDLRERNREMKEIV